jgi:hypothetical protein
MKNKLTIRVKDLASNVRRAVVTSEEHIARGNLSWLASSLHRHLFSKIRNLLLFE